MKTDNSNENLNKLRGKRLSDCRKLRDLTQQELAEKSYLTVNYISMMENGKRSIDWDKAVLFAKILDVSADFIMCQSDIVDNTGKYQKALDEDTFGKCDSLFISFLESTGYKITFNVVKSRDKDKNPIRASLDQLSCFCLSDSHCKYTSQDKTSEVLITEVYINGVTISYGAFVFLINRIYDYLRFTLDNIKDFKFDFDYCLHGTDVATEQEIKETSLGDLGYQQALKQISHISNQNGFIEYNDLKRILSTDE